jgi:hypothetical protein
MKKLLVFTALVAFCLSATVAAQNPLDGTWKTDLSKINFSPKPDVYVLMDGMYECKTCTPPYKIKADGTDQPITGSPYVDTVAITVVNGHEVDETDKKGGKEVGSSKTIISPDGKTYSFSFTDSSNTNGGPPVTGKGEETRVASGPAGSHAISGSWKMAKVDDFSDNATVWTYKISGDEITMTNPTGQTYTAKLDGTDAPMKGDPGVTTVSVKMLGKNIFQETDKRDGKVISVWKMTVAADGKSAKGVSEDKLQNRTTEFVIAKQ